MDEILIEEKKYVSSKQAAKATGYAKDYIGQLCREGRVPARLVGRSWYVLESALHDHRFGNPKDEPAKSEKESDTQQSAWESPRYETIEAEELPAIKRIEKSEGPILSDPEIAERLQETWQAWFDRFDTVAGASVPTEAESVVEEPVETVTEEPEIEAVEEEEVPVRAIHHQPYQPTPREFLPSYAEDEATEEYGEDELQEDRNEGRGGKLVLILKTSGAVVALVFVSLAILGSGYLDKYIVSNSQVGLIAGVGLYNK